VAGAPRFPARPIVVHAPPFDEASGGAIVLHCLVDRLRRVGHEAYVHPRPVLKDPPAWPAIALRTRCRIGVRNLRRRVQARWSYQTHPSLDTPRAPRRLLREAIAVYPEVVSGNPMRSRHVVRWLLHRPGFFRPNTRFGPDEYTFFYHHAFREGLDRVDPDNLLRVRWVRDDVYFDRGLPRAGACRLIRKGRRTGLAEIPANDDAVLLDGMSHAQMAEVFNRTRILYCHDPYTMYAFYAALCGCIPVVLPQPGVTREQWRARAEDRWGIAYGEEDIGWALETRQALISRYQREREEEDRMVQDFLGKLARRFG